MKPAPSGDITRIVLLVLLLLGSFLTLLPFLGALAWATTIVVATWPVLMWVQQKTGGRRAVAVLVMRVLSLLALIAPLSLVAHHARPARLSGRSAVPQPASRGNWCCATTRDAREPARTILR